MRGGVGALPLVPVPSSPAPVPRSARCAWGLRSWNRQVGLRARLASCVPPGGLSATGALMIALYVTMDLTNPFIGCAFNWTSRWTACRASTNGSSIWPRCHCQSPRIGNEPGSRATHPGQAVPDPGTGRVVRTAPAGSRAAFRSAVADRRPLAPSPLLASLSFPRRQTVGLARVRGRSRNGGENNLSGEGSNGGSDREAESGLLAVQRQAHHDPAGDLVRGDLSDLGLWASWLNQYSVLGFPMGYYMAAQGSLAIFVVEIAVYAYLMNRKDEEFGIREEA